jgi:hypothetical protein
MRRILPPLLTCSLLLLATSAGAQRALEDKQTRPYRVLKQQVRSELSPTQWKALEETPLRRFEMRSRWVGEHEDGFLRRGTPRSKVQYLDTLQRERYRLTIKNGLLYDVEGRLFGTGKPESHLVMDEHGNLYGRELPDKATAKAFAHSSYVAGGPLAMSVEVTALNGRVRFLKNRSGHYRPFRLAFFHWLLAMERAGLDLSEADIAFDKKSVVSEEAAKEE